jgi:hypothetical protein
MVEEHGLVTMCLRSKVLGNVHLFLCCIGKSQHFSWTEQKNSSAASRNENIGYHKLTKQTITRSYAAFVFLRRGTNVP